MLSIRPTTAKATHEGTSALPREYTYPRSWIVLMIDAYVDGRPMPRSSIFFTSDASVKRAGGLVEWPSAVTFSTSRRWPSDRRGRRRSALSATLRPSLSCDSST